LVSITESEHSLHLDQSRNSNRLIAINFQGQAKGSLRPRRLTDRGGARPKLDASSRNRELSSMNEENKDRSVRWLTQAEAEAEDRVFWHSKTPLERWAAAEKLRQIAYGYDPAARISPVFEFTEFKRR
jgi:hypothetical protein